MKCSRCNNEDELYFYLDKGTYYCRKCIMFGRIDVGQKINVKQLTRYTGTTKLTLDYSLTDYQKRAMSQLKEAIHHHKDVLVFAATGAGKTEMVMELIEEYLNEGKKVGIAIARRQVVLEIKERMSKAFKNLHVVAVCEGFTKIVDGDLIVCTMHQLHRYYQSFDLLIMDEIDAFPYANNEVLESIALQSCKGNKIYLTATPDSKMLEEVKKGSIEKVELFVRPHGFPLIVPKVKRGSDGKQLIDLYFILKKHKSKNLQTLVFVPTIALSKQLAIIFNFLFKCTSFSSKTLFKDKVIQEFRNKRYNILFCTTVLERGITIKGVEVIVFHADHMVFNEASLTQIVGRVGRSMDIPTGNAYYLSSKNSEAMKKSITMIQEMNSV